jgi:hypothetical protein
MFLVSVAILTRAGFEMTTLINVGKLFLVKCLIRKLTTVKLTYEVNLIRAKSLTVTK